MTAATTTTSTLRRRRGLTEEAASAAVDTACRRLRLPTIRSVVEEAVAAATKDQLTYTGFLAAPPSAASRPLTSRGRSTSRTSTMRRTRTSTLPPSSRWPPGIGSAAANPSV